MIKPGSTHYVPIRDLRHKLAASLEIKSLYIMYDYQEKIRGQSGRLQVQAFGYVNSIKVIFGDISRTEVCFPRHPH